MALCMAKSKAFILSTESCRIGLSGLGVASENWGIRPQYFQPPKDLQQRATGQCSNSKAPCLRPNCRCLAGSRQTSKLGLCLPGLDKGIVQELRGWCRASGSTHVEGMG